MTGDQIRIANLEREQRDALRRQLRQWIEEAYADARHGGTAVRSSVQIMAWAAVLDWINEHYPEDLPPGPVAPPETAHQRHRLLYE